jgi:hypothetical protein
MKQLFRVKLLVLMCLSLVACATSENYRQAINSWQGGTAGRLTHVWGYPDRYQRLDNGNKLYIYNFHVHGTNPTYMNPGSTTVDTHHGHTYVQTTGASMSGGGSYDLRCKAWFEVNHEGRIVNTSFRGNDCLMTKDEMFAKMD